MNFDPNEQSLEEFLRRCYPFIIAIVNRTARRYTAAYAKLADDLAQEACRKLLLREFVSRREGAVFGYISAVTINVVHEHFRYVRRSGQHVDQPGWPARNQMRDMKMDLNCDMGELPDAALEESLMRYITSANVACGGQAGDAASMARTVHLARRYGVAVGAHPGYPDLANFGRVEMALTAEQIAGTVFEQVRALAAIAGELTHVKPHGALYNVAAKNAEVARAIAEGVARFSRDLPLVGLAGAPMLDVWRGMGFRVAAEGFADRRYQPDGTLRPRKFADALITEPEQAAAQAVRLAGEGGVQTICIHSDTPGSVAIVAAVSEALRGAGFMLKPPADV